jgi:hypothetical protein
MAGEGATEGMTRRDFLGAAAAAGALLMARPAAAEGGRPARSGRGTRGGIAMIRVEGDRIEVETSTLRAVIERGFVTSLKSKATGEEFLSPAGAGSALQLVYAGEEVVPVADPERFGQVRARRVSDRKAEVHFHGWDGDGVVVISVDPETGDLLVEPSAASARPGVRSCRWELPGIRGDLQLVAPFFQGAQLPLDDPLIRDSTWHWPHSWEAGLAILQGAKSGFWVHTQDADYHYKSLRVGAGRLAFDTQAYGPIDDNRAAGGLCWRINVYEGDWHVPAARYRDWLWQAYRLDRQARPEWIHQLRMAISWCPTDPGILDALATRVDPRTVLLHVPNWRTDGYDENYPNYVASDAGRAFVAKGRQMGFRTMPHCNSIDMDPSHPVYALVRDFQYRDIESKRLQGWSWYHGRGIGVPESNAARSEHRDKKVMIKVHPGLGLWRALLGERIQQAAEDLDLETVFIDVTLCTWNLHQCLVEGLTPTEGMKRLTAHIASLGNGLAVGGEGLNEITMQDQSFAQAHLFQSWQTSAEGLERAGGCDLNEFLFGRLCRTFGYSGLSGADEASRLRMRIHDEHGAIPTITIRAARDIEQPNEGVAAVLKRAGE